MSVCSLVFAAACSSKMDVKKQDYAAYKEHRTYEYEFPVVWNAVEKALSRHKVIKRDPEEANALELKKLINRSLETDWVYSKSRDKYVEYKINDLPKRKNLQVRFKYKLNAEKVVGGTDIKVALMEEIEELDKNGEPAGYSASDQVDTSRISQLLDDIKQALWSGQE